MPDDTIALDKHLHGYFSTPVLAHPWPGSEQINAELKDLILKAEAGAESQFRNVIGGWGSSKDFLTWDANCVRALADRIQMLISAIVGATSGKKEPPKDPLAIEAWANVLRDGGYHAPHSHMNAFWSGAYYVSVGEPDGDTPHNGYIELFSPNSAMGAIGISGYAFQDQCRIKPEPGLAVLFPSWTRHMVHPYHGRNERISIAFNLIRA